MNQFFLMTFLLLSNIAAGLAVFLLWGRRFETDPEFAAFAGRARRGGALCALIGALAAAGSGIFSVVCYAALLAVLLGVLLYLSGRQKSLVAMAALAALCCVVAQGAAMVPVYAGKVSSFGSVAGLVPMLLLIFGSLGLGAEFCQWRGGAVAGPSFTWPLRLVMAAQLLTLALVPCAGENADPALQFMGIFWMDTQLYWAGVLASGVTIGLTFIDRATAVFQFILLFFSMFCVRTSIAALYFLMH